MNDPSPKSYDASRPAAAAGDAPRPHQTRWWCAIAVLGMAAIGTAIWYASGKSVSAVPGAPRATGSEKGGGGKGGDPASRVARVGAAPVKQGTLDIYLYALGTVTPLNAV